jgi:NADPH:quinone reductase
MSYPSTIHAINIQKQGDLDVIEKNEIAFARSDPSHLIVKMHYGGVNFIDTYFRYVTTRPMRSIR